MKKLFLSVLCLLAVSIVSNSTILIVKEYGVNATYPSIAAALAAAANNDTIVIYDKPSGQLWTEDIYINKNLTFLSTTPGARFKPPGNVYIAPSAGMDMYFIGWDMDGRSFNLYGNSATPENRARITITDCINVADINLNTPWVDARIFYNRSMTGTIYFQHGMAIGNITTGSISVQPENTDQFQNDSILIIGNKASGCYFVSNEAGLIANNYFSNNYNGWEGAALRIDAHSQNPNAILSIVNNTFVNSGGGEGGGLVFYDGGNLSNIKIVNNYIYAGYPIWNFAWWNGGQPFISHNFTNNVWNGRTISFSTNNELNYSSNASNILSSIDEWGRAGNGSNSLINKGNYLGEYYDIDLTRNDIGTYGGPYCIDNYTSSSSSKGRVLYINIRHQLSNLNQILNVKGSAGSKF